MANITDKPAPPERERESKSIERKLTAWLKDEANSHCRESLLLHRLLFDIQLAAARRGYYLNAYFDDVARDGFDVIFDDQDCLKKTQVKSVVASETVRCWSIHKKMLRPSFFLIDTVGFEASAAGEGTEGGVILMQVNAAGADLRIRYFYTDLFVLLAFDCEVIARRDSRRQKAVEACFASLMNGIGSERINVPKAAFIEARGPNELLALLGMHSLSDHGWKHHVIQIASNQRPYARALDLPCPLGELKRATSNEISILAADADLQCPQ